MSGMYSGATTADIVFALTNPIDRTVVLEDKRLAEVATSKRFRRSGHNDESDAFRHCLWSALMARDLGREKALRVVVGHETFENNPALEHRMDMHNNVYGIKLATDLLTRRIVAVGELPLHIRRAVLPNAVVEQACWEALEQGKLVVVRNGAIKKTPVTPSGRKQQ